MRRQEGTHLCPKQPLKSTPVSSIRACTPASSFPSSWVILKLRTSHTISTHQVLNEATHREYETRSRVSRELVPSQFSEKPSTYALERSNEHSKVDVGLAVKPAPALSISSEIGERLRVSDTAVSIQNKTEKDEYAPEAFKPDTSAPSVPFILHNDMA